MPIIGKDVTDFVRECEVIHGLLAQGALLPDERALIEFSCLDLLNKLKLTPLMKSPESPVEWQ